jgi:hypothetical protein
MAHSALMDAQPTHLSLAASDLAIEASPNRRACAAAEKAAAIATDESR